jgi:hypothetical protein
LPPWAESISRPRPFSADDLYGVDARFGIADYVVVDLNDNVLLRCREPHELGYGMCDRLFDGDEFELATLPGITLRVDALLK